MQAKETMQTHNKTVASQAAKTDDPSTLRAWQTPAFKRLLLKEALSGIIEPGIDGPFYS